MKKQANLGEKLSGSVLSKLFDLLFPVILIGILFLAGCKKDKNTPPIVNDPLTVTLSVNGITVVGNVVTDTIPTNTSEYFFWTSNADSAILTIGSEKFRKKGTDYFQTVPLTANTTYFLEFFKKDQQKIEKEINTVVVVVPSLNVVAVPDTIYPGITSVITITTNVDSITVSNMPGIHKPGSDTVSPISTTTYDVCGYLHGVKVIEKSVTVVVAPETWFQMITSSVWGLVETDTVGAGRNNWGVYQNAQCVLNPRQIFLRTGI